MAKLLYVVKTEKYSDETINIRFNAIRVFEETETEYIFSNINRISEDYQTSFPKKFINKELKNIFVTDRKNKKVLAKQIKRIYTEINSEYKSQKSVIESNIKRNDAYYEASMKLLMNLK